MAHVPSGTESARPFLPARDFDLSRRFYVTLGFEKVLDGDVAVFRVGSSGFVDDLDAWWVHIVSLDLQKLFGVPPPRAPAMQPWGLRVAYVTDPSGVLWHVAQRRPGTTQDF